MRSSWLACLFRVIAFGGESQVFFQLFSNKALTAGRLCFLMIFGIILLPWEICGLSCRPISCSLGFISKGQSCLFSAESNYCRVLDLFPMIIVDWSFSLVQLHKENPTIHL
jgi:hypothetical protein